MSNLPYKNPISPLQVYGSSTVDRSKTFGTTFSVLNTGGFMEVYTLTDLNYLIPTGQTGNIEFTGNTIPIQFKKGSGSVFSPDVLTLNSDNISSGRRRLGMLVYVYETKKIYQHTIDDYDNLWLSASTASGPGGSTVVISDFGTTVKNNTVAGQNFINAWTASTIEGISGYTNLNAAWRELKTGGSSTSGDYLPLSGGTVTGLTNFTNSLYVTGGSEVFGYQIIQSDVDGPDYVSRFRGFGTGATFLIGVSSDDTFGVANDILNNAENQYRPYNLTASDIHFNIVSLSGTFVNSLVLNQNGSVNVGGNLIVSNNLTANTISASTYQNLPPATFTGGTINGGTNFTNGLTANTISATTYQNLPNNVVGLYLPLSGGTVTGATTFQSGLTANTISATTYQNLPVSGLSEGLNISITGSNGNFTISFTGTTGSNFTGGTVSGATNFTNGLTANTISATTYYNHTNPTYNFIPVNSGGTFLDSFIKQTGTTIFGVYENTIKGLQLNFSSNTYSIGDALEIGKSSGLNINTSSDYYSLGRSGYDNNNPVGFTMQGTTIWIGDKGGTFYGNQLWLEIGQKIIKSKYDSFDSGLLIDWQNKIYSLGGHNNNTKISINDDTKIITLTNVVSSSANTLLTISETGEIHKLESNNLPFLPLSGGTVSGATTFQSGFTANTINVTSFTGTTDRVVQSNSGGTLSASLQVITAYLNSGSTQANQLSNTNNWDINGNYTGTTITGTFMGQKYYDGDYFYEAIADNLFIRLIRG